MHRQLAQALLFALLAGPLAAQTVQGTVVTRNSHEAYRGAHVALLDDSLHVVRETDTDSTFGAFYLDAPRSGRYALAVYDRLGNPYASAPFQLDSGAVLERQLNFPTLPPMLDSLPVALDLTARPREHARRGIEYPDRERTAGRTGHVRAAFIVNADGLIAKGSLYVIEATNSAFARAVREAEDFLRFPPASAEGRAPRVVSQLTFGFNLIGDSTDATRERGDVQITAFRPRR
jgi:hypothetical protein